MPTTINPPHAGAMGYTTSAIVDRMKSGKPGDTLTPQQLTQLTSVDCRPAVGRGYPNVRTAIKHVQNTYGITWRWSRPTQAWVCLDDEAKIDTAQGDLKSAGRKAKGAFNIAKSADPTKMSNDKRLEHNVALVTIGLTVMASSGECHKRTKALIQDGGFEKLSQPSLPKLLELMRGANGTS
jgi:hypothetical protein